MTLLLYLVNVSRYVTAITYQFSSKVSHVANTVKLIQATTLQYSLLSLLEKKLTAAVFSCLILSFFTRRIIIFAEAHKRVLYSPTREGGSNDFFCY